MNYPVRKNPRLFYYDYSQNGAYFITICTHNRKYLFSHIDSGSAIQIPSITMTQYGKTADSVIKEIPEKYAVKIDNYVIMPNHIHLLIQIDDYGENRAIRESPLQGRSVISKVVGYLKMNVSKQMHESGFQGEIWQRSFHDHIIRGQKDYEKIWLYIESNPMNWDKDCFYMDPNIGSAQANRF